MAHEFSDEYAPLKNVMLQGYANLGGFSFKNIDGLRDGCELHLHRFSGMVMVKRDGCVYALGSTAIQVAEMADAAVVDSQEASLDAPNSDELEEMAQIRSDTPSTDAILAELGHNAPNLGDTAVAKRQKRTKRSE